MVKISYDRRVELFVWCYSYTSPVDIIQYDVRGKSDAPQYPPRFEQKCDFSGFLGPFRVLGFGEMTGKQHTHTPNPCLTTNTV